MHIRR